MSGGSTRRFGSLAVVVGVLFPLPSLAASFDCAKAQSGTERLICGDDRLSARDDIMARLYASAVRADDGEAIKAKQRAWLAKAQACTGAACLWAAYDARIGELLATKGGNALATHYFSKGSGGVDGTLDVVGPVGTVAAVTLTGTYVGPGGAASGDVNTSGIGGVLDLKHGSGEIVGKDCTVTFRRADAASWTVVQHGSCAMAANVTLGGTYRR